MIIKMFAIFDIKMKIRRTFATFKKMKIEKNVFYLGRQQVQFVFRSLGEGKSEDLLELLSI